MTENAPSYLPMNTRAIPFPDDVEAELAALAVTRADLMIMAPQVMSPDQGDLPLRDLSPIGH